MTSMLCAFSILVLKERQEHLNGVVPASGWQIQLFGTHYCKVFARFSLDWTMEGLFWLFPLWARTVMCSFNTAII